MKKALLVAAIFAMILVGGIAFTQTYDPMTTLTYFMDSNLNVRMAIDTATNAVFMDSGSQVAWSSATADVETPDIGLSRSAAGMVNVTDGAAGIGSLTTGGLFGNVTKVTGTYTVKATDYFLEADATTSGFSITFPDPHTNKGQIFYVIKTDSGGNTLTLQAAGGGTFNGTTTKTTSSQYGTFKFISDGAEYFLQ